MLTLVQYPKRREDRTVPLLEKERVSIAADEGYPVLAFRDRNIPLFRQDVFQIQLKIGKKSVFDPGVRQKGRRERGGGGVRVWCFNYIDGYGIFNFSMIAMLDSDT